MNFQLFMAIPLRKKLTVPNSRDYLFPQVKNSTKTLLFLIGLSTALMFVGYSSYGRQGLLAAFTLAVSMNFFIYFYSEQRLKSLFEGREIEGQDPWGVQKYVTELAFKARIPTPRIHLIPLKTPTCFSVGRSWTTASIVISEEMLKILDPDELKAVIAHEISHIKELDILAFGVGSALAGALMSVAYGTDRFFKWLFRSKNKYKPGLFTSIVAPLAALSVRLTSNKESDMAADEFASITLGDPEVMARSIWKLKSYAQTRPVDVPLSTAHIFIVNPLTSDGASRYFHTQANVEKRIKKLIGRYPI